MAGSDLKFPYDHSEDYKGRIVFRVYRTTPPGVSTLGAGIESLLAGPEEFLNTSIGNITGTSSSTGETINRQIYAGGPLSGGSVAAGPTVTGSQPISGATQSIDKSRGRVSLYLPAAINITDGVSYDQVELGTLGAMAANQINKGASPLAAIEASLKNQVGSMVEMIKVNPSIATDAARLAAVKVASKAGQNFGNVASSVFRTAINPNRRQLFRGVNMREFGFTFKMIANSAREAREIESIIKFFRTELYPVTSVEALGTSVGYQFPNLFDIQMTYNNKKVATSIAPSYLKNIDVVYNPSSMGFHVDGKPSEVDLRLTFTEERTLDRSDIEKGY